jgi:hypothetical protein
MEDLGFTRYIWGEKMRSVGWDQSRGEGAFGSELGGAWRGRGVCAFAYLGVCATEEGRGAGVKRE